MAEQPRRGRGWGSTLAWIVLMVGLGVVASIVLDTHIHLVTMIPKAWKDVIRAGLVLVIGTLVSRLLERRLFRLSVDRLVPEQTMTLRYLIRLVLFIAVAVSVLTAFGVGLPSVIFGGTFLSVIIGLAGQTIFSNIIGGLWLIFFRPFRIGDTIGLIAWQYPLLMPSFPHEAMRPMYVGKVLDINLMYTKILNTDGYPQEVPNGIITSAFIENRSMAGRRRIRLRFDLPYEIDSGRFTEGLQKRLEHEYPGEGEMAPTVLVGDIYPQAYSVVAMVHAHDPEDLVRHRVLSQAMAVKAALAAVPPATDR